MNTICDVIVLCSFKELLRNFVLFLVTIVMERQEADIKKIQQLLSDAESTWKELPRRADTQLALNITLESIETIRHDVTDDRNNSKHVVKELNSLPTLDQSYSNLSS